MPQTNKAARMNVKIVVLKLRELTATNAVHIRTKMRPKNNEASGLVGVIKSCQLKKSMCFSPLMVIKSKCLAA